ncbi:MAG: hypothetical protein JWO36_1190 [Myxococcales bacterium]|nr:hypothetical protein [Myxococcales bacterium]
MRVLVLVMLGGCLGDIDPAWQLDHDRIIAVRATPPHIAVGEVANLDALIAHKGGPTDLEAPIGATAVLSNPPADLFTAVHFDLTKWEIDGRLVTEAQLDIARAELKLDAGAPVPLRVTFQFPDAGMLHLIADKTIYLGDSRDNPAMPPVTINGAPPGASLTIPIDVDVPMQVDTDPTYTVNWLTSCGTMHDDDQHHAFIHVLPADPKSGELAVVIRDRSGGVVWQVWPIVAQ